MRAQRTNAHSNTHTHINTNTHLRSDLHPYACAAGDGLALEQILQALQVRHCLLHTPSDSHVHPML